MSHVLGTLCLHSPLPLKHCTSTALSTPHYFVCSHRLLASTMSMVPMSPKCWWYSKRGLNAQCTRRSVRPEKECTANHRGLHITSEFTLLSVAVACQPVCERCAASLHTCRLPRVPRLLRAPAAAADLSSSAIRDGVRLAKQDRR